MAEPVADSSATTPAKSAKSPWASSQTVGSAEKTSLADVMSEQLAGHLSGQYPTQHNLSGGDAAFVVDPTPQELDDALIAQMLQYECDLEHDELLRRKERHYNGPSKVSVSLSNYRHLHPVEIGEDDNDEFTEIVDFAEPKPLSDKVPQFSGKGYVKKGNDIVTKHDADICGRRNANRMMNFPTNFVTGDDVEYDSKLSNKVFNELKQHAITTAARRRRVKDPKSEVSTSTLAVDPKTRILLYKLVNGGTLDDINGVISVGKEAVVFHANGGVIEETGVELPEECALKVFKTTLNEFRNRDPYISEDYRFQERFKKLNPRKIVRMWAEKEMLNLKRLYESGIPCPKPVLLRKHILVMEFLGKEQKAAPKLKDVELSSQLLKQAYMECCEIMRRMYKECRLVHADFSEYNLLWYNDNIFVIDVSQSVEPAHPRALEFLYRDCSNIYNFFSKRGLDKILTIKELFKDVTGVTLEGEGYDLSAQLARHDVKKEKAHKYNSEKEQASFDHLYDMATRERTSGVPVEDDDEWVEDDDDDTSEEE